MQFYINTIPSATKDILEKIKDLSLLHDFYLSGGTALSLLLGHRESEDLDFFIKNDFKPLVLQEQLVHVGKLENVQIEAGTLNLYIEGVKLQFLHYPYNLLEELIPWNNISLSSVVDIACTKLITISMRGSKKDFIDLYVILQHTTLKELFSKLDEKYKNVQYNYAHILKSLVYFEDAETQPMPRIHIPLNWEDVKKSIVDSVKTYSFD
ncbi:MAG TPA: nucleotidyl transferase AbiEii/AbiGii toxin family protein [Patescibacteria group bacterium]|nr:nucleotidyl transferase AbiEii/AbiGii toxin family protein [Patescibacteria group bacterium]